MSFFARVNQVTDATPGTAGGTFITNWWRFLQDLIDAGWRVLGSGDTFTFKNAGQTAADGAGIGGGYSVITSANGGEFALSPNDDRVEGGIGNCWSFPWTDPPAGVITRAGGSWIRLATPANADHYREYLFQVNWKTNNTVNRHYWNIWMARNSTAFSAGGSDFRAPLPTSGLGYVSIAGPLERHRWPTALAHRKPSIGLRLHVPLDARKTSYFAAARWSLPMLRTDASRWNVRGSVRRCRSRPVRDLQLRGYE
jgi:hypothetical protein